MPYANFLRISLGLILALAISIILMFSAAYLIVSVYSPTGGVLADSKPVLPNGFHGSSRWEIGVAFLQCVYLSVVTFVSLGYADIVPGATAKFLVVAEVFCGVLTMGFLVAKIVSLPVDQVRKLRRNVVDSWWIDRVEKGISETEDLFGLLKFETHGIYGICYHGTDYNKNAVRVDGFEAILSEIEMPRTTFRVPFTYTKDHAAALVELTFFGERRRFNRFEGTKVDLANPDQPHLVEGRKITDAGDLKKLNNSATRHQAIAELIGRYFPEGAG